MCELNNIVEVQFTQGDKVNTIRGGGIEGPGPPKSVKTHIQAVFFFDDFSAIPSKYLPKF